MRTRLLMLLAVIIIWAPAPAAAYVYAPQEPTVSIYALAPTMIPAAKAMASASSQPASAPAAAVKPVVPPTTPGEAADATVEGVEAMRRGAWGVGIGLLLMVLVFIARRMGLLNWLPSDLTAPVTAVVGLAGTVGILMASGIRWNLALIQGFVTALSAPGFWESGGKQTVKKYWTKKEPAPAEEKPTA